MTISMENLFPGYFKPSEKILNAMWQEATFVFDANILLNLYRYSNDAREDFFNVFNKLKQEQRIWVPHQSVSEYLDNKISTINAQALHYTNTVKELRKIENSLGAFNSHPFLTEESTEELNKLFYKIIGELESNKDTHIQRIANDEIQDSLNAIFSENVGKPLDDKFLEEKFPEWEVRYSEKIPPGYKDIEKDSSKTFKGKKRKFGDLIIWFETLLWAKENEKSIIFVTDDKKEDWWVDEKTINMPRPELLSEFKKFTNKDLLIYKSRTFIEESEKRLGSTIRPDTVYEIQEVGNLDDFISAVDKYPSFYDLILELNSLGVTVGEKIPAERDLSTLLNQNRSVLRENLSRLESYGFINKQHGKPTVLIRTLPDIKFYSGDKND